MVSAVILRVFFSGVSGGSSPDAAGASRLDPAVNGTIAVVAGRGCDAADGAGGAACSDDGSANCVDAPAPFADFEGDGEIGMAEFNRVMTADDVMKMKNTLTAVADAVIVDGKGNVVEDGPVDYNAVGHRL